MGADFPNQLNEKAEKYAMEECQIVPILQPI